MKNEVKVGCAAFFSLLGIFLTTYLLTKMDITLFSMNFLFLVVSMAFVGIGAAFLSSTREPQWKNRN